MEYYLKEQLALSGPPSPERKLTFITLSDQRCRHSLFDAPSRRDPALKSCFCAGLGDVSVGIAEATANDLTGRVLAAKFSIVFDRRVLGCKWAKGAARQVLDPGHAQDGLLFDLVQCPDELLVQKLSPLCSREARLAAIHRHARHFVL